MSSPAEPRPELSEPVPLTAGALDQLGEQVAYADSRGQTKHAVFAPDLQGTLQPKTETSSQVPESGGTREELESSVASKASAHTTSLTHPSALPGAELHNPDASMTDYVVDGLIYRSPDTLNTLIEIRHSPGKGVGVFALRDLPPGTLLLSERPLIALNDDGSRADPLDGLVNALPPPLKRAYRALHGYQELAPPRSSSPSKRRHAPPPRESLNRRVLYSNGFAIETTTTAVFALASRINHSCVPNARFHWDGATGRMDYVAAAKLLEGEEVTIDYGHKKGHLKKYYGFECDCGGCTEWGSVSTASTGGEGEGQEAVRLVQSGGFWRPVKGAAGAGDEDGGKADGQGKVEEGVEQEKENAKPGETEVEGI